jgi:hypothetical protein
MDILEREWSRTSLFAAQPPGSPNHTEYIFWRNVSVIWTCATIEAYVNEEGASWVGAEWYKKAIERGRIDEKIHLVYALKYRSLLPIDSPVLKRINQLFQRRNELIHPKAKAVNSKGKEKDTQASGDSTDFQEFRCVFRSLTSLFQAPGVGEIEDPT